MSPTPAKPPSRRQRSAGAELSLVPGKAVAAPRAPAGLSAPVKKLWHELWRTDVAQAWFPEHLPGLRRLFLLYEQREVAAKAFADEPVWTGSTGQDKLSGWAAEVASLDARILALEDRFGLSPKSKVALGIEYMKAAEATERAAPPVSAPPVNDPRQYDA